METEEWKTVVYHGEIFEDYEVSTLGNIRSLNYNHTGEIKTLKPYTGHESGYLYITLWGSRQRNCRVHIIVAETWIPNPDNKPTVNHINENKHDNRVENLEWATQTEQIHHGTRTKRQSKKMGKRVRCVETGIIYDGTRQAEKETGVCYSSISRCCNGAYETAGKLHWEYVD